MEPRRSGRATKPSTKLLEAKEEVKLVEVRVIRRLKVKASPIRKANKLVQLGDIITEESQIDAPINIELSLEPANSDPEEEAIEEPISYLESAARKSAKVKELKRLRKLDF